jgi:hypothetical protein
VLGDALVRLPKLQVIFTLALMAGAAPACALLFQGKTEEVSVVSDPPGAAVTLNNGVTMTTPFSIEVRREDDLQLHFAKPGYQSTDVADNSEVEPGYLMADIIPFMIPWAIDAGSGAGFAHQQTSISVHLDPEESAHPPAAPNLSTTIK